MAMEKPALGNFIWWWPLQEANGTRYDKIAGYQMADNNTVLQAAGHVQTYSADFEKDNSEYLDIADAAWNTFGNESICMWAWFRAESFSDPQTLFGKWNESNDHHYGAFFVAGARPRVGIARAAHAWDDTAQGAAGVVLVDTWYLNYYYYDAAGNELGIKIYDTAGAVHTSGTTANITGFGPSIDNVTLQLGRNEPGGVGNSNFWDGRIEQFAGYKGLLTANELLWVVNGGAGQSYYDLVSGQGPIWWLTQKYKREAERLYRRNQMLKQPNLAWGFPG